VPPFDVPITTTKDDAIYNMHTYCRRSRMTPIQQYIRHYTQPGDLVLDPFCGSGGTALAALMEDELHRHRPLSGGYLHHQKLLHPGMWTSCSAPLRLKAKVKPEMDWLYETRCDRCDGRATTAYTVYSYGF
jgi:hypothetical protein